MPLIQAAPPPKPVAGRPFVALESRPLPVAGGTGSPSPSEPPARARRSARSGKGEAGTTHPLLLPVIPSLGVHAGQPALPLLAANTPRRSGTLRAVKEGRSRPRQPPVGVSLPRVARRAMPRVAGRCSASPPPSTGAALPRRSPRPARDGPRALPVVERSFFSPRHRRRKARSRRGGAGRLRSGAPARGRAGALPLSSAAGVPGGAGGTVGGVGGSRGAAAGLLLLKAHYLQRPNLDMYLEALPARVRPPVSKRQQQAQA